MSLCEIKNIASIAKTLELFFAVMFLFRLVSCSSFYFPVAVECCSVLVRILCAVLVSNRFMFLLGNLIVLTLFVNSNRCSRGSEGGDSSDEDDYLICQFVPLSVVASDEAVTDEKRTVDPVEIEVCLESGRGNMEPMRKRRTLSEDLKPEVTEKLQLRRSETDLKLERSGEEATGRRMTMKDLSNEEFQRKVEAFIEQQQRFLREECYQWREL